MTSQLKVVADREPEIDSPSLCDLSPGVYPAFSASAKVYFDNGFRRWVVAVQFDVLADDLITRRGRATWFLNLGRGKRPRAGLRSKYLHEWLRASGTRKPERLDRMPSKVFVRRHADVRIERATGAVAYSVVREIVTWKTG